VLLVSRQLLAALLKLRDVDDGTVDPRAGETLTEQVAEQGVVLSFAPAHDRRKYLEARALFELEYLVDDLFRCLLGETSAIIHAVLDACAGVQQAQVVVHLGDGAHRRARVARRRLLVD